MLSANTKQLALLGPGLRSTTMYKAIVISLRVRVIFVNDFLNDLVHDLVKDFCKQFCKQLK